MSKLRPRRYPRGASRLLRWGSVAVCCVVAGLAGSSLAGALQSGEAGLASRLAGGDNASEHWDLIAKFETGHALFVRTLLTNAGPGSNTAVVTGQIVFPNGKVFDFDNGRTQGNWRASRGGLYLKIGGTEFDLRGPERRFSKQSKKRGIKLDARFAARPARQAPGDAEPGIAATTLAPIECTFKVTGMPAPISVSGVAMLRHAWSAASELEHTARWIDIVAGDGDDGIVIWGLQGPKGKRRQWLSRTRGGKAVQETTEFTWSNKGSTGPEPAYPMPRSIELRGDGVAGKLVLAGELVRADPMEIMPQPFRWFLARQTAPRRVLSRARLELEPRGDLPAFAAAALVGVNWTNPLR